MNEEDRIKERWIDYVMQRIGQKVRKRLPEGFLFAVLVLPSTNAGIGNYVSNASRKDMIKALRETADRIERNQDKPRYD